jgi:hypothetical protein
MSDPERGPGDTATPDTSPDGDLSAREAEFTRRALLQAGWTAPVVLAAALPQTAAAQTAHGDTHTDAPTPHGDSPHGDSHSDEAHADSHTDAHLDQTIGAPPPQGIHLDQHLDTHTDVVHSDAHSDAHTDT